MASTIVLRGTSTCPLCKGELPEQSAMSQIVSEKASELIGLLELFKMQHNHDDPLRSFTLLKIRNHIDSLIELDKDLRSTQ